MPMRRAASSGRDTRVPAGYQSLLQRIQAAHRSAIQIEIEQRRVLRNPRGVDRLREHHESMLDAPPQKDLRRAARDPARNVDDRGMCQPPALGQRAVRFDLDTVFGATRTILVR